MAGRVFLRIQRYIFFKSELFINSTNTYWVPSIDESNTVTRFGGCEETEIWLVWPWPWRDLQLGEEIDKNHIGQY